MYEATEVVPPGTYDMNAENRKRPLETAAPPVPSPGSLGGIAVSAPADGNPPAKKPNYGTSFPLLKLLIPNFAAGALIGRNGQNISQIQAAFGAKIRLSSSTEFYPGTNERIAVITGEIPQIIEMQKYIMEKVYIDPTRSAVEADPNKPHEVKIVIPNATAGLVIGKAGANIKNMTEVTGAKIIITSKDQESFPGERIVTVSGSNISVEGACSQIIPSIAVDPENMTNRNVSYDGPGLMRNSSLMDSPGGLGSISGLGNRGMRKSMHAQSAMQAASRQAAQASMHAQQAAMNPMAGYGYPVAQGNDMMASQYNSSVMMTPSQSPTGAEFKTTVTIEMQVPDIYVGAVLGKGGKTANELMQYSGARLQFSAKGEYAHGTADRVLTIQCDNMTAAQVAHFLVCQKIDQAKVDFQYQSASRSGYAEYSG